MSKQPNEAPERSHQQGQPPSQSAAVLLLSDIANTTWRMFIPSVGFTMLGLYLDTQWHTAPIMMIIGIIVGGGLSALLVYRQLKRVNTQ
jgi:F0F1-type ATP synthase assembly protein I